WCTEGPAESDRSSDFLSPVKRRRNDHRVDVLAPAVDEELRPDGGHRSRQIPEPDVLANGRTGAAARAEADDRPVVGRQRVAVTRDAAAGHLEADELARHRRR